MQKRGKKRVLGRVAAIVVAAGEGRRFGSSIPKQWADLGGRPILSWTLSRFERHPLVNDVILVIDSARRAMARRLVGKECPKVTAIVSGGKSRAESVRRGLKKVTQDTEAILIHDGVRPFFEDDLIDRLLAMLQTYDGVIPVTLVGETLKRLTESEVDSTVDRKGIAMAKTPQAFRAEVIHLAHALAKADHFEATDDSVLVERMGSRVGIVQTTYPNIKITLPDDLLVARGLIHIQGGGQE
jgi:2-C-methyl-D-erythritol 4-phosphate cytidylyltransferase